MDIESLYYAVGTEKTFDLDDSLPSLPVPALNQTLQLYLKSVRPHVNDDEFARTQAVVASFQNNEGQLLQNLLMDRSKNLKNWLEVWWENVAYLMQRTSLIPTSNLCGLFPLSDPVWMPGSFDQIQRAGLFTYFLLEYWKLLRSERLKPDKPRGERWSMTQFRRCFNTIRIPGEKIDELINRFVTEREGPPTSEHVAVLCDGHIYKMNVLDSHYEPLSPGKLRRQFEIIKEDCLSLGHGIGLASLTYGERTQWAKDRLYLKQSHAINRQNLETIENAIFCVSLDDSSPENDDEIIKVALGGQIGTRWADTLTTIVFKNGTVAFNADHTPCDGMVGISLNAFIYLNFLKWNGDLLDEDQNTNTIKPRRLDFILDVTLTKAISTAVKSCSKLIDAISCRVLTFTSYGKTLITSRKLNPDTFVQMGLQLAYFRSHNRCAPTYETATTRRFYNGRTETVRSCTIEATQWVKSMLDATTSPSERWALFQVAIQKHDLLMKMGKNNEGCDRHLLGLYMIALESGLPIPEIFKDPAWIKSGGNGNFILSTSLTGYTPASGAVLPMCLDGYGVFYSISPESIRFNIVVWKTSNVTNLDLMYHNIRESLLEIQTLSATSNL